jgi:hypothetical protein
VTGRLVEQPLQLAFAHIDPSSALDERIADLLTATSAHLPDDPVRSLYFANEALVLAESADRIELELRALRAIISALEAAGRSAEAAPYIVRALDLADSVADADLLSSLVEAVGAWAITTEQELSAEQPDTRGARRRAANAAPQSDVVERGIDDPETGLLNALALAAELLSLEERRTGYALIQMVFSGHSSGLFIGGARSAAEFVGDRGLVARNGASLLTAVLPGFTGIAAMSLAEHIRRAIAGLAAGSDATIGIGVAIKQPGETSRNLLRRVADRAEEASRQSGVSVAG